MRLEKIAGRVQARSKYQIIIGILAIALLLSILLRPSRVDQGYRGKIKALETISDSLEQERQALEQEITNRDYIIVEIRDSVKSFKRSADRFRYLYLNEMKSYEKVVVDLDTIRTADDRKRAWAAIDTFGIGD